MLDRPVARPAGATSWPQRWLLLGLVLPVIVGLGTLTSYQGLAVASLGAGVALGLLLTLPVRGWPLLVTYYVALVAVTGLAGGRAPWLALVVGLAVSLQLVLLGTLGQALGLTTLRTPADLLKLGALAGVAALLAPVATWAFGSALGITPDLRQNVAATVLTIAVGVLVSTPLVLAYPLHTDRHAVLRHLLEVVLLAGLAAACLVAESMLPPDTAARTASVYLVVVVLGWVAVRFGPGLTAVFLTAVSAWVGYVVAQGRGPLAQDALSTSDAILATQAFLIVTAIGVQLLAVYAQYSREQGAEAVETAEMLTNAVEGAAAYLFVKRYDPATDRYVYVEVNHSFSRSLGFEPEEVVGRSDEELMDAAAAAHFRAEDDQVRTGGERLQRDSIVRMNGREVPYYTQKFPIRDADGVVVGVGGVSMDRSAERRREQLLQLVFARSPVPTARLRWTGTAIGEVVEVNDAFAELLGASKEELVGRGLDRVIVRGDRLMHAAGAVGFALPTTRREMRLRRVDGAELTVLATTTVVSPGDPADAFVLAILEDVTAERAAEAGLVHRATHDPLTDLLNRQALTERLAVVAPRVGAGSASGADGSGLAVMCCDLDGFKQFNDSLGHDTGDRVLLAVAERLRRAVRPSDVVGRLGADEFVVVCDGLGTDTEALTVAERIGAAVSAPLELDGRLYSLGISIGVVRGSGAAAEDLLRQADIALTRAKDLGRDRVELYRPELDRRVQVRLAMRETVRLALSENRVEVHLQPVVDLRTGCTVGAEALVRLRDLDGSLLAPAAFIGVSEESGLVVPLGLRVLDLALALQARWAAAGQPIDIAVNVSPRQLAETGFPGAVATLLSAHGVDPTRLTLEVTETAVVDAAGPTLPVLRQLRAQGVHVAIDDFGTGYSSLTSLRDLPADVIKIDRSFVSGMAADRGDTAIVRAVLAMAHATGRLVVAEGVETADQAALLTGLGCDRVQGYWYSRPRPATDFDPAAAFPVVTADGPTPRSREAARRVEP